jgi:hypothetical protein
MGAQFRRLLPQVPDVGGMRTRWRRRFGRAMALAV